ncbi:MAG: GDSL-type esterase/lipase family protein [Bacteroidales bacterium]|jgi:lysophospholipase L1-like esterase
MKKIVLLAGCILGLLCSIYAGDTIPANHNLIEYTGRIDFTDSLAPKFSYSGVSVRAFISGTSVSAILSDDIGQNYYNVILDRNEYKTINVSTGRNTYILAEGLSDTIHEIELFKRTELTFGKTQFHGFILDDGASLDTITNIRPYFIEYIGNSITCGYGNEGTLGESFGPETENHFLSYAAVTSRNFNARHMSVSRSGIGIYRNYDGPATGNADCMTNLYSRIFLYDAQPIYDFNEKPDVICINLGTNDFSTSGADSSLFVSNYLRLIDTIQKRYEMPDIVCLLGPMLSGSALTDAGNYIQFIADSANNKEQGDVSFFEMSAQTGSLGFAVDYHPTVAQHEKNAKELTEYLHDLMNWKISPYLTEAKTLNETQIQLKFNTPVYDPSETYSGFSLTSETSEYVIQEINKDENDHAVIQIAVEQSISEGEDLFLTYSRGSIESEDSVELMNISNYPVTNTVSVSGISGLPIQKITIELFPSPNQSDELFYNIVSHNNKGPEMKYEIIAANGVSVLKGNISGNAGTISIHSLSDGLYYIRFLSDNFSKTKSFVVSNI